VQALLAQHGWEQAGTTHWLSRTAPAWQLKNKKKEKTEQRYPHMRRNRRQMPRYWCKKATKQTKAESNSLGEEQNPEMLH
jgi:hypothetical protein